jgi:hypothetical protein
MHPFQGVRLNPAWPRHGPHSSANLVLPIAAANFLQNCKSDLSTAKIDSVLGKAKVSNTHKNARQSDRHLNPEEQNAQDMQKRFAQKHAITRVVGKR